MNQLSENISRPILEAKELTMRYEDGVLALNKVSFEVNQGEVFAMLGGNGAGKTTAINLFLGFLKPTSGQALVKGISTAKDPLETKKHIAFVSENVMLYPNFTAIQNLDYFARLGGHSNYTRDDFHAVLNRVGLAQEFHSKRLKDFSKGMRQKCGIAIAILKDAPAILLDEPTSGLDPKAGHDFIQLLKSLRADGKAILMSTHDIFRAKEVADTVAFMADGQIVMKEPASALVDQNLESLYMQYMAGQTAVPAS